ncbi:unnamed protein product [Amaranthus hypochondriacus]
MGKTRKVDVNPMMKHRLNRAVVVGVDAPYDVKQAVNILTGTDVPFVRMSSFSPTKIILFFDDDVSLECALARTSPLRELFTKVHRWSERETYVERLVWLECSGMNPYLWSFDKFRRIGELWGKTLRVQHEYNGLVSLTSAKILIKTTTLKRIESRVKLEWTSGSCEVWVNELQGECMGNFPAADMPYDDTTETPGTSNKGFINDGDKHIEYVNTQNLDMNTKGKCSDKEGDANKVVGNGYIEEGELFEHNNGGIEHEQRDGASCADDYIERQEKDLDVGLGTSNDSGKKLGDNIERCKGAIEKNVGLNSQNIQLVGYEMTCTHSMDSENDDMILGYVENIGSGEDKEIQKISSESMGDVELSALGLQEDVEVLQGLAMEKSNEGIMREDGLTDSGVDKNQELNNKPEENLFVDPIIQNNAEPISSVLSCEIQSAPAWVDPIATVEAQICFSAPAGGENKNQLGCVASPTMVMSSKRPRGRPKKKNIQTPIVVYSPPLNLLEARETWNLAKALGVKAPDEEAVISELRKSKRIMALENKIPIVV